jgi:hypothetical protein
VAVSGFDDTGRPPDAIIQRILNGSSSADYDDLKLQLLEEFLHGRPTTDLLPLLRSKNDSAVQVGIWIASELGVSGRPLVTGILPLLSHTDPTVRFFALDCVLAWASGAEAPALSSAVVLIEDPHSAVRWKALHVLSLASPTHLAIARAGIDSTGVSARHAALLTWLLGEDAQNPVKVLAQLQDSNPLVRKYGVVAAARLAPRNRLPLACAAANTDADVRTFACDMLSLT